MSNFIQDSETPPERALFCNRTLNMRSIRAVGFDMDYTLVHYDVHAWEARAYAHVQARLLDQGLPVAKLRFDPNLFARGLILDVYTGNIVKANRFGYVTQAAHGTRLLPHEEQRRTYSQVWVELSDARWVFLNTLFSLSEACLFGQLVDLFDRGLLPAVADYQGLHDLVASTMNAAHLEGELKAEIIARPEEFVDLDPLLTQTLLDLKESGKKLFLATNSEWHYTRAMMGYVFDAQIHGPDKNLHWRDLFDLVVVQARKPSFFEQSSPFQELGDDDMLRPLRGKLRRGPIYSGGNAEAVQAYLGCEGSEILYVGDHVYADVHVSSQIRRWRTALVLREIEQEILAEQAFATKQVELEGLMRDKQRLDHRQATLRLGLQRIQHDTAPPPSVDGGPSSIHEQLRAVRTQLDALEARIVPLAKEAARLDHPIWGPSMRAGNDKSRLARQIERHADVYTSRVSNFLSLTPYGYLHAARGSLPHDPTRKSEPLNR